MIESCYIHIPFCSNICSYCDFSKLFYSSDLVDRYLIMLEKEMATLPLDHNYKTIYIGGGTPSSLSVLQLEYLFKIIDKIPVTDDYELTIECNVENVTKEKLILLKEHRVNRLSIGVESFNKKNLALLERNYTYTDVKNVINLAKKIGFSNINVDLIYALPSQSIDELEEDINELLNLGVTHISTYSLMIEPNTKLFINKTKEIDEELDYEMYNVICQKLENNGYEHYEISNFSLPGYQSKHNKTYWQNKKYYGFGLGASGYIENIRYQNTKSITEYLKGKFRYFEEIQDDKIELKNEIILRFRTSDGINKIKFKEKYGFDLKDKYPINDLINQEIIIEDEDYYVVSQKYWYLLNEILLRFIEE